MGWNCYGIARWIPVFGCDVCYYGLNLHCATRSWEPSALRYITCSSLLHFSVDSTSARQSLAQLSRGSHCHRTWKRKSNSVGLISFVSALRDCCGAYYDLFSLGSIDRSVSTCSTVWYRQIHRSSYRCENPKRDGVSVGCLLLITVVVLWCAGFR